MTHRWLILAVALAALSGTASCGGGGGAAASNAATSTTEAGTTTTTAVMGGSFTPAVAGTLTVQAALPAPGWWEGNVADRLTGGYEWAMAKEIAKRLGVHKTVFQNVSYDELIAGGTGDATVFDVALAEVPISARHKAVDYTIGYFGLDQGVMVNRGTTVTAANLRDLKWAVQRGTTGQSFVEQRIQPTTVPATFNDLSALFGALKSRAVDAVMMDTIVELPRAKAQHASVVAQFRTGEAYGGVVPKGSTNLGAINQVVQDMIDDGTLNRLATKWLAPTLDGDPTKVPYLEVP